MDAFYASVEQRDDPSYRNKPVVVGGAPESRGVVATCSYEARRYGIHSAMPSARVYRLCPHAIFIRPRFSAYRQVSQQLLSIFRTYTPLVEPLSLDEAYLDVTDSEACQGSATLLAREIKQRIRDVMQLTASAGVSYNKFLAKIASDLDKPNGLTVITPQHGPSFVEALPIGKFHGVGKATESKMKTLGIDSGADLKRVSLEDLQIHFGKAAYYYYHIARGADDRLVVPQRARKSLGAETTFECDLDDRDQLLNKLAELSQKVGTSLAQKKLYGYTLTLKVKYDNFQQITRSITADYYLDEPSTIFELASVLLAKTEANTRKVRLLGVTISNFHATNSSNQMKQQRLF